MFPFQILSIGFIKIAPNWNDQLILWTASDAVELILQIFYKNTVEWLIFPCNNFPQFFTIGCFYF